jgi:hypothetical protein
MLKLIENLERMKEVKIGLKISKEKGFYFFGLDELNQEICNGAKVVEIKQGDIIMKKNKISDDNVNLSLSGFSMTVTIE